MLDVVCVAGAPASGKSTYVDARRGPCDVVVDFDRLAQALGSPTTHGHAPEWVPVVAAAREAALAALRRAGWLGRVWVIACDPVRLRSAWPGADVVVMDTPLEECLARAEAADRPSIYRDLIVEWFRVHGEASTPRQAPSPFARRPGVAVVAVGGRR